MFIDRFFRRGRHNPDDTRLKSLLKTISWWVLASTDSLRIAWLLTGNLKTAGSIMSLEIFTKMFLYYVHARFLCACAVLDTIFMSVKQVYHHGKTAN